MDELLPAIEVETAEMPRFSVIWLHGLGADGSDFESVVPELGLDVSPGVRFIFPHAPQMPVTCNGGYVMPAWYDIISLDSSNRSVDEAGIIHSRQAIRRLIARENRRGVPCARIFLAGFSQGGAVAYTTALTHPEPLAGLIALSTYIPTPQRLEDEATDANKAVPVFAAHGSEDDVVSPELGIRTRDFLIRRGYPVEWHEYPMPHSVCLEEIKEIGRWLRNRMAASSSCIELSS
ncbi:MAG: alpha/beta hydrolase [Rhodocyclaceae bacterium]|nr:MAG: alpha/beta hydrolase [Rhodocyclaceae bacterium]